MEPSPPYDARAVANFILDLADSRDLRLTQLSILKILYFCHGWYLAINDKPLCIQQFEAWEHGPVVKVVRDAFKIFNKNPISGRATKLLLNTGEIIKVIPHIKESDERFIVGIFDAYHIYDAWQLSGFTHEAGSPWDRLWNAPQPIGRLALRIKNEEIRAHFRNLRQRFPLS